MTRAAIRTALAGLLISRAQRTPYFHLAGYMGRWWLFRWGRVPPPPGSEPAAPEEDRDTHRYLGSRIHHILRSDAGRAPHDHPWAWASLLLAGRYVEVVPILDATGRPIGERRREYGPGSVLFRRARQWHRLEVKPGETVWTLFFMGPKQQEWGFLQNDGTKVLAKDYHQPA